MTVAGVEPLALAALATVVFLAALARSMTGFGFAIAAMPLLSLTVAPKLAVAVAILLQVLIGVIETPRAWGHWDRATAPRLLLGTVAATPAGIGLLLLASDGAARLVVALLSVTALTFVVWPRLAPFEGGRGRPLAVGLLSGLCNGFAAMPGPPAIVFYLLSGLDRVTARASMTVLFAGAVCMGAVSAGIGGLFTPQALTLAGLAAPCLLAGGWIGERLFHGGGDARYRAASIAVLAFGALAAAVKGLAELF